MPARPYPPAGGVGGGILNTGNLKAAGTQAGDLLPQSAKIVGTIVIVDNCQLFSVNQMSKRKKHPIAIIEDAIKYAEEKEWTIKVNKRSHAWGRLFCPGKKRGACIVSIWSTPQIGRASCRERVQISVVAVSLKKKNNQKTNFCFLCYFYQLPTTPTLLCL